MVTLIKYGALGGSEKYNVNQMWIDGLSIDSKPTTTIDGMGIPNGSVFTEVDTGKTYMFDEAGRNWYEVSIGGGGTSGGIVLVGETTTALTDNATTNPITVDGQSYTAKPNDAVIYGSKEFLFDGTKWHEFGDLSGLSSKDIGAMTNYAKAQSASAITTSDTLNQAVGKLEYKTDIKQNEVLGSWTAGTATSHVTPIGTDTVLQALQKIDNNQRNDEADILSVQGEAQTNNITLTDMNSFATGTVKTGYVDNVANITGYVTIRTYTEPNSRKMQVLEAQDGTTRTRYFNGTTWTDFENSLSAKVDGMSDVISSILVHGTQSWDTIQTIVRSGLAPQYYPVGTLLYDNMDESTGKAFRVVGYDNFFDETLTGQGYSHSMTLLEEKLNYPSIQFDAPEAWLYLSYDGQPIVSGQAYRFTIPNWDASYGGNKTYIFTATANVSKETAADAGDGGQLTLAWAYQQNPTSVSAYANNSSTTALFTANIAVWNGTDECINLGTIKLAMSDADSTYGKLNHIHRARYGSNNYYQSGMRQWLNATTASDWWQPTTIFDRAYGSRSTAGRLSTLNANMVAKIATPTITCITNNLFETGFALNTQYTVKDKIFLLTHTEVGLSDNPNIGSTLAYYVGAANSKRIKYKTDNTAQHWWLHTPDPSHANSERFVNTSGALTSGSASYYIGAAAACIIQ